MWSVFADFVCNKRGQAPRPVFETGTNGTENSWEKFQKMEIVEFPKSEPFNRKFRKFQDESQMERKFPGKVFRKFGWVYLTRLSSSLEVMQILFSTQRWLVLLAAITANWTSHARMTRIR